MVKTYKVKFKGREIGALGVRYVMYATVEADNPEGARLKLYDNYEHVSMLNWWIGKDEGNNED